MNKSKKKFDAVGMMRSIRDQISAQIDGMTVEEELAWLKSQDLKDPFLKRLRDKATQPLRAADAEKPRGEWCNGIVKFTGYGCDNSLARWGFRPNHYLHTQTLVRQEMLT